MNIKPEPSTPNKIHFESKLSTKKRFFDDCLNLLNSSFYHEQLTAKHAAIIVNGNRIIGQGVNVHKTHTMAVRPILWKKSGRILECAWTIHAEMNAIRSVRNKELLIGATIYVARMSDRHGLRLSCPCDSCQYYINFYGIKKIVYTTDDNVWHEVKL